MSTSWECQETVFGSCQLQQIFNAIGLYYTDLDTSVATANVVFNESILPDLVDGTSHAAFVVEYQDVPLYQAPASHSDLTAHLALYENGRILLHYQSLPTLIAGRTPHVFIRSRSGLVPPYSGLGMDIGNVQVATDISFCPVPKVICLQPACGPLTGGTLVTITGKAFDHSCLAIGQSSTAGIHCHFGAQVVPAVPVSGSNNSQLQCTTPPVSAAGVVYFQLSFGRYSNGVYDAAEFLGTSALITDANDYLATDSTFAYSNQSCGCSGKCA